MEARRGLSDPLELELQIVVSHWMWVLGTRLRSSEEQPGPLTTELSPQLPPFVPGSISPDWPSTLIVPEDDDLQL